MQHEASCEQISKKQQRQVEANTKSIANLIKENENHNMKEIREFMGPETSSNLKTMFARRKLRVEVLDKRFKQGCGRVTLSLVTFLRG